jgi:anti-anti-sigma factor
MRHAGLEWIYRLIQEPRRLFGRYIKDLWIFSRSILAQWWALQLRNNRHQSIANTSSYALKCSPQNDYQLTVCPARLDAIAAEADALGTADIASAQRHCFVQMAGVTSIDSTGIGYLIRLQKRLRSAQSELVLIAPSAPVSRALKLMRIDEFFSCAPDLASAQYLVQVRSRERSATVTLRTPAAVTPLVWHGEITAGNARQVWENTREYLETPPRDGQLALDLSAVRFIDSSGLGLMIRAKKLAQQKGAKLVFIGIQPAVKNVIQIAHLQQFLLNDEASDAKSRRSSTWRDVFTLPEANATPTRMFGNAQHAIFPEPVTNAVLATSHE